jgi:hypothetical protein
VPTPQIVDLVDRSGSAYSAAVDEGYRETFGRVVAYAAHTHGSVVVETIDANPLQHSGTPISADFTLPRAIASNPVYAMPLLARRRTTAKAAMDQLLARPPGAPGTDVFAAMLLAQRVFESDGPTRPRFLVVSSDMLQSTAAYDFYSRVLDDTDVERVIQELKASRQLPDLRGVSVWVVGAGQDAGNEISSSRNQAIERFFRRYFAAAGARVVSFAATLEAFPPTSAPRA